MKKLNRKESHVSKDFKETLKTVVRISGIDYNDNNSQHFSGSDSVNFSSHSRSSSCYLETIDWKSIDDSDVNSKAIAQLAESSVREKNGQTNLLSKNSEKREVTLKSETEKLNTTDLKEKQSKVPLLKRIFSFNSEIPFETTAINNLPFVLPINRKNDTILNVNVYSHFTVDKVIEKVSKKIQCDPKAIALFFKNTRLERHITLSWYNITMSSQVNMEILNKVKYYGSFLNHIYTISIFTSEKVWEIKKLFSHEMKDNPDLLELKYKDIYLKDNRQFFLYNIPKGSNIDVIKMKESVTDGSPDNIDYGMSPGFEFTQCFLAMTSNLKECKCYQLRIESMACAFMSMYDDSYKNHKCMKLIKIFKTNKHIQSCPKSKTSPTNITKDPDSADYFDEKSLNESIHAEIEKIDSNPIKKTDLDYLCHCKNFKSFKHFLRDKIGTKCGVKSVAMLYNYAQTLVKFLNSIGESDEMINKMLDYIKRYFLKYFEKPIIARGGLLELTRKESTADQ